MQDGLNAKKSATAQTVAKIFSVDASQPARPVRDAGASAGAPPTHEFGMHKKYERMREQRKKEAASKASSAAHNLLLLSGLAGCVQAPQRRDTS